MQCGLNFMSYLKQKFPGVKPQCAVMKNTGLTSWDLYGTSQFKKFTYYKHASSTKGGNVAAATR